MSMLEPQRQGSVLLGGLAICVTVIVVTVFIYLMVTLTNRADRPTPERVFNSHLQAIEDQDWEYAHAFLASDCPFTVANVEQAFTLQPLDRDYWEVETVFMADDEALLWLPVAGLQYMYKEDDDWKVSCMGSPPR